MYTPTKENTLYLVIKQDYFNKIMSGEKKTEEREIAPKTYKKFLVCDEQGNPYYDSDTYTEKDLEFYGHPDDFLMACKDGKFPFLLRDDIKFLNLAVGYKKERDTATVEVTSVAPQIGKNAKGQELRFDLDNDDKPIFNSNGNFCVWQAVFHLGKIVEKVLVSKNNKS